MIIPKIKVKYIFKEVDKRIFDYPKWKLLIPIDPSETEFNLAWKDIFKYDYDDCKVEYGKQELMGNLLGNGLIVNTPNCLHYCGGFQEYTDDPILGEDHCIYYSGYGCTWSVDIIGQRFALINAKTSLPESWKSIRSWEIIKRYKPFLQTIFQ